MIQCECAVIIIFFKTFTLQSYHSNFGRRASIILHPGSLQQTEPILAVLHRMTYVYIWKIGLVWSFMETAKNHHDFGQKKWALLLDWTDISQKNETRFGHCLPKNPLKKLFIWPYRWFWNFKVFGSNVELSSPFIKMGQLLRSRHSAIVMIALA